MFTETAHPPSILVPAQNFRIRETLLSHDRWPKERFDEVSERYENRWGNLPPKARAIAIIPVSLHEESVGTITHLLSQYTKQDMDREDSGVLLSFNHVGERQEDKWQQMMAAVTRLSDDQSAPFYLATTLKEYNQPQPISKIRTDAWNIAMWHVLAQDIEHEVIGISNDADPKYIPPDYVRTMTEAVEANPGYCYGGPIIFENIGPRHLLVNKLLRYRNFFHILHNSLGKKTLYENNIALSLNTFAAIGSWGQRELAEAESLLVNLNITHTLPYPDIEKKRFYQMVDARPIKTSGRREAKIIAGQLTWFSTHEYAPAVSDAKVYAFATNGEDSVRSFKEQDLAHLVSQDFPAVALRRYLQWKEQVVIGALDLHDITEVQRATRLLGAARNVLDLAA